MSVNAGSSSLKFQVFKMPEEEVLAQGNVERIGLNDSIFGMKANGEKIEEILDIKDHAVAVKKLMEALIEHKVVNSLEDIKAIGHRVVHGGEYFSHSVPVDADVEAKVEELCALAPLHNPAALVGYRSFRDAYQSVNTHSYLIQHSTKVCQKKTIFSLFHMNIILTIKYVVMVLMEQVMNI